ncbi:MAG: hypothetical protein R3D98_06175 [Candidatus Krumholzibacteriia bacterium]
MARNQFSWEKRQKELLKKKKKEEKRSKRLERKQEGITVGGDIAEVNEFGEVIDSEPADADDEDDGRSD